MFSDCGVWSNPLLCVPCRAPSWSHRPWLRLWWPVGPPKVPSSPLAASLERCDRYAPSEALNYQLINLYSLWAPLWCNHAISQHGYLGNYGVFRQVGNIGQANYAASKAGVEGLTRTAAKELSRSAGTLSAYQVGEATHKQEISDAVAVCAGLGSGATACCRVSYQRPWRTKFRRRLLIRYVARRALIFRTKKLETF